MDDTIPELHKIYEIIKDAHSNKVVYTMSDEAKNMFIVIHDELCDKKIAIVDDEDRRGIISKAKGQVARLAMVIHCIEQAIINYSFTEATWKSEIQESSMKQARIVINYIIEQKFALMNPEIIISCYTSPASVSTGIQRLDSNSKYLNKFLSFHEREVTLSHVSRFRLMPPSTSTSSKNKYPVEECRSFMRDVEAAGFGNIINTRRSLTFRKRRYCELGIEQQETLKRMNLSSEQYDSFLDHSAEESSNSENVFLSTPESQDSQNSD